MKTLSIDIETYSEASLPGVGVYRYADDETFEILLFAYSVDGGEVQVVDIANGEYIPFDIIEALSDPRVEKWAFNAQFERVCISKHLGYTLSPVGWHCTMVWATSLGFNLGLEGVAEVLGLEQKKMSEGKKLIQLFSQPCKPTKVNGGRTRNTAEHLPAEWETFKTYCAQDVAVELAIQKKLSAFPLGEGEWLLYWLDQTINDRGVKLDSALVRNAISLDHEYTYGIMGELKRITGLANPNSPSQLLSWLRANGCPELKSMAKADVAKAAKKAEGDAAKVLQLRQEAAKSSVSKYKAMERCICRDGRARGLLQFVGAGRTGRWAGRLIQVQNLPRQTFSDFDVARDVLINGGKKSIEMLWGSSSRILSELIRTAFIAKEGHRFIVADFSAIEARVIAWLAGEEWVLDLFKSGGDIYCETGTRMFRTEVTKKSPLRQRAKVAVLACGYQGGRGALEAMGAIDMGIPASELQGLVDAWRAANPHITKFWWDIDRAAKAVIKDGHTRQVGRIYLIKSRGILFIRLPSGRCLAYPKPQIGENRFGGESITHMGLDPYTKKWARLETYGGKLVENIVQATARDVLAHSMLRLEKAGYPIVMHIHDEVVIEADKGSLDDVCRIMSQTPKWADGLPLAAEGFESDYYKKG